MEIMADLPVDDDGFLRRECPSCLRQFKWFHGQTADRPDDFLEPEVYFCPYCAEPSRHGTWWTPEQLEYLQGIAAGPLYQEAVEQLKQSLGSVRSRYLRLEVKASEPPDAPAPLLEPNDMAMVASPCHPFEPLKVQEDWIEPLACLMCGQRFTV